MAFTGASAGLDVVGDGDVGDAGDVEALLGPGQLIGVHLLAVRRVVEREPAVGDLGGLGHVLGPFGADVDRDLPAQRVGDRLQRLAQPGAALAPVGVLVELAVELELLLPGHAPGG